MLDIEPMPMKSRLTNGASQGTSSPLGATSCRGGVNFSVFSKHATGIELLLFDDVDDARAPRVIRIDPASNRTGYYWHVLVPGVRACYELCEDTAASGEHEAGESDEVQSFQGFRQSFIVPGEATEPGSPGEEPFHNPSTR